MMTEALIAALGDTLAEVEAETLGDTMDNEKPEELLHSLAETVAEIEAETLYKTRSDIKAETLVEGLHDTLAKDDGRNNWYHTRRSGNQALLETLAYMLA